jgi:hypothetical protein
MRRLFPSRAEREAALQQKNASPDEVVHSYSSAGVPFTTKSKRDDWLTPAFDLGEPADLPAFLSQFGGRGIAAFDAGEPFIPWRRIYEIKSSARRTAPVSSFERTLPLRLKRTTTPRVCDLLIPLSLLVGIEVGITEVLTTILGLLMP